MKSLSTQSTLTTLCRIFLLAGIVLFVGMGRSWGQTPVYADAQTNSGVQTVIVTLSQVLLGNNAVTTPLTDSAYMQVVVSATGTPKITLKFTTGSIPANTPVFIKIKPEGLSLASLLGAISAADSLDAVARSTSFYTSTAIDGSTYLVVTSTQTVNKIGLSLSGLLSAMDIFYAFYYPTGTGCITPITTTSSSSGVTIGSVDSLSKAIDGNINTGSTFNVTAAVAGTMTQSIYYNNTGASGDAATVALSIPASGLANLSLLGNITIQAYNGNTAVGTANTLSNFLTLNLLNLVGSNNPMNVSFPVSGAFNRIDITSATTLGLLSGVKIYEVTLTPPKPTFVSGTNNDTVYVCRGSSATLIADNPSAGNEIRWYSSALASNTTVLSTGASYTPPFVINTDTVFFAATGKTGCTPSSERVPVRVLVKPIPTKPIITNPSICSGNSVTISVTTPIAGNTYNWYAVSTGGSSFKTGTSYTTSVLSADTTFYVQADSANGCPSKRDTVIVSVKPLPAKPTITNPSICSGNSVTISVTNPGAGNTYNWYAVSTGGSSFKTGTSYTTSILSADTTFYVQADSANGCSSKRDTVIVSVKPLPAKPTITNPSICSGNSVTISVTNPGAGNTYNWYAVSTGGSSFKTGTSYTTSILSADTTFYVQADSANGCSSKRDTVIVSVKPLPAKPTITNPSICSGNSVTISVTNPVAGNTYNWYAVSTGGSSFKTASSYTTSVLSADTTFYVQADSANGCSSKRDTVIVSVKRLPAKPSALDSVICRGTSITLAVINPLTGDTYNWYKTVAGGTSIQTGTTYTTTILNADTTIYLQADSTNGCSSARDTVVVSTLALPAITFTTPIYACIGTTLSSIAYSNAQNTPAFYHFAWGSTATSVGFSASTTDVSIVNPIPIIIPNTANAGTYTGNLIIKNATNGHQCPSTYPFSLIIIQKPNATVLTNYQ